MLASNVLQPRHLSITCVTSKKNCSISSSMKSLILFCLVFLFAIFLPTMPLLCQDRVFLPARAWYGMEDDFSIFHTGNFLPFHFHSIPKIFHSIFHSILKFYKELVVQNLRREPHSSVTVRRFRKLKSCFYVIAIPSGWHVTALQHLDVLRGRLLGSHVNFHKKPCQHVNFVQLGIPLKR